MSTTLYLAKRDLRDKYLSLLLAGTLSIAFSCVTVGFAFHDVWYMGMDLWHTKQMVVYAWSQLVPLAPFTVMLFGRRNYYREVAEVTIYVMTDEFVNLYTLDGELD